ncbi:bifunctional DNA primase/polymerase [Mycobacterium noviomagense]|uniref:DNA primase/polymerase bifunctional N-terminal domain-containing protein n=1 Tax=Mycobacterium noviomagense TaxID=459858 RepID=A0A7I7PBP3_9MYCO|nr:bifunctional DNA primase/polymerase [Mycobacterium noviomagense]ORB11633.1 hypothetical protein BST37_18700 [Mycobacterium noviomagense]BBY06018.1 hypothetical protein MNVI_13360 [Mycobacterium noviomagense]
MTEMFDRVQQYAALGYCCTPASVELDGNGKKRVSYPSDWSRRVFEDPADWAGWDAIAINTGLSGLVVVDIDTSHGKNGFESLEAAGVELPSTPLVIATQSGGRHFYYRAPEDTEVRSGANVLGMVGVDIRASGGNVFAPGTVLPGGGAYRQADGSRGVSVWELPEFPAELAKRLVGTSTRTRDDVAVVAEPADVTPEQREAGERIIAEKLAVIAAAGAGERNAAGRQTLRIVGIAKTLGFDAETINGKITAAYDESGGDDPQQIENWIRSAWKRAEPENPLYWTAEGRLSTFWDARPELAHIRQAAHAELASPWAVLGALLVRVLADVPPSVRLDTGVNGPYSGGLNFYAVLAARSGGGKGIANRAAQHLWPSSVHTTEVASGEAIPRLFASRVKEEGEYVDRWIRDAAVVYADELGSLKASASRTGSTLMQRLCTAFTDGALGFTTVDESKNVTVEAGSYRLCALASVQYDNAHLLLSSESVSTGQAQRFVWFPANDTPPDTEPDHPGALGRTVVPVMLRVEVCGAAKRAMREARKRGMRGDADALDGHRLYAQVKVAYALAVLNGHHESVRESDWNLAGVVMAMSDRTREAAQRAIAERSRATAKLAGEDQGLRAEAAAEAEDAARLQRQVDVLRRKLHRHPTGITRSDLRRALKSQWRADYFELALDYLIESGEVVGTGDDWYRLTQGVDAGTVKVDG